jgi:adhesin transport system membrane fusion protein
MSTPTLIRTRTSYARSNSRIRFTFWIASIGFLVLVVWASFTEIDQVTRVSGQVIASSRTQVVQTVDGGVLQELMVREGDAVRAGQLLATLAKTRVEASVNDSKARVAALRITLSRLRAEVYGTSLFFDKELHEYPQLIENQTNLFDRRKTAFNEDIKSQQKVRSVVREELNALQPLEEAGDISRNEVLRIERQLAEIDAHITMKRNKFFQDAQTEMAKAQEDLNTQDELLNDRSKLLEQTNLVAPTNGIVKNIKITTLGGVLRPGDTVVELLPTGGSLVVEVKVQPSNVAWIQVGQRANVKLDAFDFSIFGGFNGDVIYISPDTLIEETSQGPQPYYRVHVRIGEKEFNNKRADRLEAFPGMTAQVDIVASRRTILSYIVNPISKVFVRGLKQL